MKRLTFILSLIFLLIEVSFAQDEGPASHSINLSIPDIAILDIEGPGGNSITLTPSFSGEAGEGLDFSAARDESLWLNYTSILSSSSNRRKITVKMDGDSFTRGLTLRISPSAPTGIGDLGNARNNAFRITNREKNLITTIRNCYTGDGPGNGSQLAYFLRFNDRRYSELRELNNTVLVTFTIVDY